MLFIVYVTFEHETKQNQFIVENSYLPEFVLITQEQDVIISREPKIEPIVETPTNNTFLLDEPIEQGDNDIIEAITISTSHPFWADVLAKGSLTGFIKPRHIEAVRQYTPDATDNIEHNRRRWEAEDEKHRQQQHARGLDEDGKPLLRVAVQ